MGFSPILGRFLQRDPAGFVDAVNLYQYVDSDPVTRSDPYGLQATGAAEPPAAPSTQPTFVPIRFPATPCDPSVNYPVTLPWQGAPMKQDGNVVDIVESCVLCGGDDTHFDASASGVMDCYYKEVFTINPGDTYTLDCIDGALAITGISTVRKTPSPLGCSNCYQSGRGAAHG